MQPVASSVVVAETGVSYRVLDHWVRTGLILPDEATPGSGKYRRFPRGEVGVVRVVMRLRAAGFELGEIRRWAPGIRAALDGGQAEMRLAHTEHVELTLNLAG